MLTTGARSAKACSKAAVCASATTTLALQAAPWLPVNPFRTASLPLDAAHAADVARHFRRIADVAHVAHAADLRMQRLLGLHQHVPGAAHRHDGGGGDE